MLRGLQTLIRHVAAVVASSDILADLNVTYRSLSSDIGR